MKRQQRAPGPACARLARRMPIMGKLPGWDNAWVSTGHFRNGILLAPISGQLMAKSILAGKPEAQLVIVRPDAV